MVKLSRVVLGTFSNFLVLFFWSILNFLKTSIRRQRIDFFFFFEVKIKCITFSTFCAFFSPIYYLLLCFFSPSPVRFHNHHVLSAFWYSLPSFQDSILSYLYSYLVIHSFIQSVSFSSNTWSMGGGMLVYNLYLMLFVCFYKVKTQLFYDVVGI